MNWLWNRDHGQVWLLLAAVPVTDILLHVFAYLLPQLYGMTLGRPFRLDPDILFTIALVFLLLLPSLIVVAIGFFTLGRHLEGVPGYLLPAACGGVATGCLFLLFDYTDTYFTPPGPNVVYFFVGVLPGALYGVVHRLLQVRLQMDW